MPAWHGASKGLRQSNAYSVTLSKLAIRAISRSFLIVLLQLQLAPLEWQSRREHGSSDHSRQAYLGEHPRQLLGAGQTLQGLRYRGARCRRERISRLARQFQS